jgi:hypothetical protein
MPVSVPDVDDVFALSLSPDDVVLSCVCRLPFLLRGSVEIVDDCSYVRHSPSYKPVRCGSLQLCESFSSLQT